MTERYAAVLALSPATLVAPPGVDAEELRLALLEDTYEVVAATGRIAAVLALCPPDQPRAEEVTWPGTPVLRLTPSSPARGGGGPPSGGWNEQGGDGVTTDIVMAVLDGLDGLGADEGGVVAGDAPDLPPMLLGKLFQGLEHADVAVCPAEGGGLVALAARLPRAAWLADAGTGLDAPDALDRLRAAAPSRRALSVSPGWRRLRRPEDVARLDPGLEGWEATRAMLSGHRH